ncbi:MAG: SSI family serine proteinase inhibitor [Mycobacteriales bacterium]
MAILVALAGCADPAGSTGAGGSAKSPAPPPTELSISVTAATSAPAKVWTLSCQPTAGNHPQAADACAFVSKTAATVLAPVPANQVCTQIFGGPQVATVKGRWRGTSVDAKFARNNGCEIARWDKVKALIGNGSS